MEVQGGGGLFLMSEVPLQAINAPIQGTPADIIKRAILQIEEALWSNRWTYRVFVDGPGYLNGRIDRLIEYSS